MVPYVSKKLKILSFALMVMVVFIHSLHSMVKISSGNSVLDKGYSSFIQDYISRGVANIAVPLFFLISGYLFFLNFSGQNLDFYLKIKKRIRTLVIPYFFWTIWGIIFYYILQHIPFAKNFFTLNPIENYNFSDYIDSIFIHPIPYQLWFLRDLILFVFLSPLIYTIIKYLRHFAVLIFMISWFYGFQFYIFSEIGIAFFIIGAYIAIYKPETININLSQFTIPLTFIWLSLVFLHTLLTFIDFESVFVIQIISKTAIVIGILSAWSIYDRVFKNTNMEKYDISNVFTYSFFLFVFHEPILSIFKKGLLYVLGSGQFISLVIYFITALLTIFISIFVGILLKRFIPDLYKIMTGNR